MPRRKVSNWGLYPEVEANFHETSDISELREIVSSSSELIARGNGRCYGDASLAETIVSTLNLNRIISFDEELGEIECESGVLLSDILNVIVPRGFFLPVTPGTKYVSIGGAVAADVHGKNHHSEGSFAQHVCGLRLLCDDGSIIECGPNDNTEIFWKTCGGMGLTGIILSVRFKLKAITSSFLTQVSRKTSDLDGVMQLFEESKSSTYSVAWIDCFSGGKSFGRSILITGEHADASQLPASFRHTPLKLAPPSAVLNVPIFLPRITLNRLSAKVFNAAYFHGHLREYNESLVHFDPFFYPLDRVRNWNRAYGKKGFLQYQFVLPKDSSFDGLVKILDTIRISSEGAPLAVLKLLGNANPRSVMSFPMEGYTLALDFKVSDRVFTLLECLDSLVLKYGGRIYLAKDARMSKEVFAMTYKETVEAGKFRSIQAKRLGL